MTEWQREAISRVVQKMRAEAEERAGINRFHGVRWTGSHSDVIRINHVDFGAIQREARTLLPGARREFDDVTIGKYQTGETWIYLHDNEKGAS